MVDFARLSANWYRWASGIGGGEASISTDCDDCEMLFSTDDYSVHLRNENNWWIIDSVDDRGNDIMASLNVEPSTWQKNSEFGIGLLPRTQPLHLGN